MILDPNEGLALTYVLKADSKPKLPNSFVRAEAMREAVEQHVLDHLTPLNANHFIIYENIREFLFKQLKDHGAISEKNTAFAGSYYKFEQDSFVNFRSNYLTSDPYFIESKEIGEQYFPDSFLAIENAILDGRDMPKLVEPNDELEDQNAAPDPNFFESEERKSSFLTEAQRSLAEVEDAELSNAEKAQARGYLIAAKALADTPDPPFGLIWTILSRASLIAGIGSFFVGLITLLLMVAP